jgi:hypothetical protein
VVKIAIPFLRNVDPITIVEAAVEEEVVVVATVRAMIAVVAADTVIGATTRMGLVVKMPTDRHPLMMPLLVKKVAWPRRPTLVGLMWTATEWEVAAAEGADPTAVAAAVAEEATTVEAP